MKVGISYGLHIPDEVLYEAHKNLFPNSNSFVGGGCIVGSMGKTAEVLVCSDCREAEQIWKEQNNRQSMPKREKGFKLKSK